jgi:hypothetical protein
MHADGVSQFNWPLFNLPVTASISTVALWLLGRNIWYS